MFLDQLRRIERVEENRLEFRDFVFRDTELVNSIGVSILLGVIDAAGSVGARLAFSDVNDHTVQLFNMLGLTRHVSLLENEASALSVISREISQGVES